MRPTTVAMAVAFGILWGAYVLLVGIANMICPATGRHFYKYARQSIPVIILARV